VHHTIEIAVPASATARALTKLRELEGVVSLSVLYGASVKPPGDVLIAHVLNREVDAVLMVAAQAKSSGSVSVSTAQTSSINDDHMARALDDDVDESPWEEIERGLRHHGQLNRNFLALMTLGAMIALAGLLSAPVAQSLALAAAGIVAPAFEPVVKLAIGVVRGSWYAVRRALIAMSGGYVTLVVIGALTYLLLAKLGVASTQMLAASQGVTMITRPTAGDWLISAAGATAGVIIVTAFRHTVLAGALIALALVPGTVLVGAGLAVGDVAMALLALRRVALDMMLIVVCGTAVLWLKQRFVHHNRRPLT
jgi:hypothetical protein